MVDVSKKTVFILLVLVIISTVISTWALISGLSAPPKVSYSTPKTSTGSGEVSLEIKEPPVSATNAQVVLDITPSPKGG